jgi:ATP-binding cassette, subfamily B (MDR/TAP), member 7
LFNEDGEVEREVDIDDVDMEEEREDRPRS